MVWLTGVMLHRDVLRAHGQYVYRRSNLGVSGVSSRCSEKSYLAEDDDGIVIVQPSDFFCPIDLGSCSIHLEVDGLRGVQIHNMIQHVLLVWITSYDM